jgi:hypothetical protein
MKQLALPAFDPIGVFSQCVANADAAQHALYLLNQHHVQDAVGDFATATAAYSWCNLPRVQRGAPDQIVVGTLTKGDLTDLYSKHMVATKGTARETYDAILVAANGKCPFCAGIGHVKTLDHYLPKSNFPLYSVLPANLVPCCRDCNTGKNASFASLTHAQSLHPYLDQGHFFSEKWVVGTVLNTNPISIQFRSSPPLGWSDNDRQRVNSHFEDYQLAQRFGVEAGAELSILLDLRRGYLRYESPLGFKGYLLEIANSTAFVINGWKRAMYAALADAEWFLAEQF